MLPFLAKPKMQTGITTEIRRPDKEEPAEDHGMMACAKDIINAVQSGDHKKLAAALRAAFELADSEPHVEGEHIGDEE